MSTREEIRSALSFVPAHDRDTWLRMGMAVKSELGDDSADLWLEWSQSDDSYNERDARAVWRSISPSGGVTGKTLFRAAATRGWKPNGAANAHAPTPPDRADSDRARQRHEVERAARHEGAREWARQLWESAPPAGADHDYLSRKRVQPHGLRMYGGSLTIGGTDCAGALVVPLRDADGQMHSLEFITANGEKRYLAGGRISGCYFAIGKPDAVLVIAEGFATAASVHEATGYATACAFNAGNLEPVAAALRGKFPDARIIIAADNDTTNGGNVGLTKARDAARSINALVAVPELDGGKCDFNDLMLARGAEAVRTAIEAATAPPADLPANAEPSAVLSLRRASEIEIEPVSWLWSGWLAAGKLHILAGVPGTGKTTIALSLAATITRGGYWPDGAPFPSRGNVVMWSGEDDPADTLAPRLVAMGADLARVHFVGDCAGTAGRRPFDPAQDMPALIAAARAVGDVRVLIVDPIVTTVSGDSHKNAEVRRGLAPLVTFGHELRAAVLGVSHFSKGTGGRDPLERLTGSLAFGALPRLVFGAAKKTGEDGKEEGRVLVRIKSNIGPDGGAIGYSLAPAELPRGIVTSRVTWGDRIDGSARDILADAEQTDGDRDERSALREAEDFLRSELGRGPQSVRAVQQQAAAAGITRATLRRAKVALGIEAHKAGMAEGWTWQLPPKVLKPVEDIHPNDVSTFGSLEHLRDSEAF